MKTSSAGETLWQLNKLLKCVDTFKAKCISRIVIDKCLCSSLNFFLSVYSPQDEALRRAIEVSLQEAMAQNQQQQQDNEAGEDESFLPPELRTSKSSHGRERRRHDSGNRGWLVYFLMYMTSLGFFTKK